MAFPTLTMPSSAAASPIIDDAQLGQLTRVGAVDSAGLPTGTDGVDSLVTRAFDLAARPALRRELFFADLARVRPTRQSHNGAVVRFNIIDDISDDPTTATLVEEYDVLPTPLTSYTTDVRMREYGRTVTTTGLLRGTSMVAVDPVAAERVGRNAGATIERLALSVLLAAGGVTTAGAAGSAPTSVTVTTKPSDTLRAAIQSFQSNNVDPFENGNYIGVITPAAARALKAEAGNEGFRFWNTQREDGSQIPVLGGMGRRKGYLGVYEGFELWVSPLAALSTPGGIFLGDEALAKIYPSVAGFSENPQVVVAPVIDRLMRFASVGWKWMGGFGRFRAEATLTGNLAG
jgi:N4-gp56 family major capsid protein